MVATVAINLLSYTADGSTTTRNLGARASDIVNVKDFGALGNGIANDTVAIQKALDAAFGTWADPHGSAESYLNRAVYFPAGDYLVRPSVTPISITGCTGATANTVTITNASPAVFTCASHGLAQANVVIFSTTGSLPTGLSVNTTYWVLADGLTANTFKVTSDANQGPNGLGAAVNTSSAGSGIHTARYGKVKLTMASTTGLENGGMAYVRGVGGATIANGSYRTEDVTSTTVVLNDSGTGVLINAAYTSGGTICPPALRVKAVRGGTIYGAGKSASFVRCDVSGAACLSTNGFQFCHVHDLNFEAPNGIAFDCNKVGNVGVNNQSNMFVNNTFGGSGSTTCDYAVALGMGQDMGSEMTFLNNYIGTGKIAGISWHNFNALSGTVIGGNMGASSGDIGGNIGSAILVVAGACPVIMGVGFQSFDGVDIDIQNGAGGGR